MRIGSTSTEGPSLRTSHESPSGADLVAGGGGLCARLRRHLEHRIHVSTHTQPTTSTSTSTTVPALEVADIFDGGGSRQALMEGYWVRDRARARLCSTLLESLPPQCGGLSLVITNPDQIDIELEESQGTSWSEQPVRLEVFYDGSRLTIGRSDDVPAPSASEVEMADALVDFARSPGADTAEQIPFGDQVVLGVGPEIVKELSRDDIHQPTAWVLDVEHGAPGPGRSRRSIYSMSPLRSSSVPIPIAPLHPLLHRTGSIHIAG